MERALQREQDRKTYPAMLPLEIAVWRGWLAKHEPEYTGFDYNVRVGPGHDPGGGVPDFIRKQSLDSSKKRIDAVARQGGQVTIVEVKDRAGLSAVGQLLGYAVHYKIEHPNETPPKMLLVARALAPGVEEVLKAHNIPHELVQPVHI